MTFGEGADAPGLALRVVAVNLNDLDQDRLATDPHVHAAFYAMRFCQGALEANPAWKTWLAPSRSNPPHPSDCVILNGHGQTRL